jgi:hypothetical protein
MREGGRALAADLIKVGHHGSINASPDWSFTKVFPKKSSRNAVMISTDPTRFTGENEVPHNKVLNGWKGRVVVAKKRLRRTDAELLGASFAFDFPD